VKKKNKTRKKKTNTENPKHRKIQTEYETESSHPMRQKS